MLSGGRNDRILTQLSESASTFAMTSKLVTVAVLTDYSAPKKENRPILSGGTSVHNRPNITA